MIQSPLLNDKIYILMIVLVFFANCIDSSCYSCHSFQDNRSLIHSFIRFFHPIFSLRSLTPVFAVHLTVSRSHSMYQIFLSFFVALCLWTRSAIAALTSGEIANSLNELAQQGFAAKALVLEINSTADAGPLPVSGAFKIQE